MGLLKARKVTEGWCVVVPPLTSFQQGLEGGRGRDRVQLYCLLTSFQGPHQKLFFHGKIFYFLNSASKMKTGLQ